MADPITQQPEREQWYCDCGRINPRGQTVCECGNGSTLTASGERVPLPRNNMPSEIPVLEQV